GLRMPCGLEVDRDEVRVHVAVAVEAVRGAQCGPLHPGRGWERGEEVGEAHAAPPGDRAPAFDAAESRDLLVEGQAVEQVGDGELLGAARGQAGDLESPR